MTKDDRIAELEREVERLKRIREDFRNTLKVLKESQNQKAIECLNEMKVKEMSCDGKKVPEKYITCFNDYIDNKIKELENNK